jgi:LysR family cys regulon transcriptional activator
MNLLQLRVICEIANHGLKITTAAETLHKSQPGISRLVREIEEELGVQIFRRRKNKIEVITEPGREIVRIAERVLRDIADLKRVGQEYSMRDAGELTVATTHTQARYSLPGVIEDFTRRFPNVHVTLRQGNPIECCKLAESGKADIAISTETREQFAQLVCLPAYLITRCVVARRGHPILKKGRLTLRKLSQYPIITFDSTFSSGSVLSEAFAGAGIRPRIVLSAVDADVSKAYVERGLGIAILAHNAIDRTKDLKLGTVDAQHLFPSSFLNVSIRKYAYLRGYMTSFVSAFAPHLSASLVRKAVDGADVDLPLLRRTAQALKIGIRP